MRSKVKIVNIIWHQDNVMTLYIKILSSKLKNKKHILTSWISCDVKKLNSDVINRNSDYSLRSRQHYDVKKINFDVKNRNSNSYLTSRQRNDTKKIKLTTKF